MRNFVQPGECVEYTAPSGGVVSGTPKLIGQLVVVPTVTAAEGARFVAKVGGVISGPKVGSQAWTEGARVYWNETSDYFTTTASGAVEAGTAVEAVGSGAGETTGIVRLDGVARVTT